MKNIYVGLLAAVACTYSTQAAAIPYNNNLVFEGEFSSLSNPMASPEISLSGLSSFNAENSVKLAAVCSVGGGGCAGLKFGEGNNSMDLNENVQCTDEGYVKTCPSGYVKDENNICPHSSSYFKCRPVKNTCEEGYSLTACNSSTQVQTASYTNEAKSTCYQCRDKTCVEGGYVASINSCQNGTAVSFANKTCYRDVSAKTCENGGYKSSIPTNNKCDSVSYCSKTCYSNCKQPTCEESGFLSACPTNHTCDTITTGTYGRTCYKDKGQPTCEDGGYKSGVPTNQVCTPVSYSGRTCYQNCYQPQCSAGGYLDACPANQSGTSVTYYGRNCVKDCKVNENEIACKIGSVLYEDKKCYSSSAKTPIGVVFDVEDKLAVALEETTAQWAVKSGNDVIDLTNCPDNIPSCAADGKANTTAIIAFGKANNISHPAAEYCNKYTTTGTKAGEWFLPSFAELKSIYDNRTVINTALNGLSKSALNTNKSIFYWSSVEVDPGGSRGLQMNDGGFYNNTKPQSNYVRAVIQYGEGSETEIECKFGSILYKDLKCYSKTKKTPIGVVIDNTNKRAIALDEARVTRTVQDLVNAGYSTTYGNNIGVPGWDWATTNDLNLMKENVDALNAVLSTISGAKVLSKTNDGYVGGESAIIGIERTNDRVNRCLRDANVDSSGNITKFCFISVDPTADLSSYDHWVRLVLFYGDCGTYQTSTNGQKCTSVIYNGNTCYKDCRAYTCSDGGYQSSNKFQCATGTLTSVNYQGLTCYKCSGTTLPDLAKDCYTAGSEYFDSAADDACNCPYGVTSEFVTTSSGKKTCYRCGTYSECYRNGGTMCLQCANIDKKTDHCNGGTRGSICACGGTHTSIGVTAAHFCSGTGVLDNNLM